MGMEKYNVYETENLDADTCPICKAPLQVEGKIKLCPKHGSAPFEKKDSTTGGSMPEDKTAASGVRCKRTDS